MSEPYAAGGFLGGARTYHRIDLTNPDLILDIYPSMVQATFPDGVVVTIDVGVLYALLGVHLRQNGIWSAAPGFLDWDGLVSRGLVRCQLREIGSWAPRRLYELRERPTE